MRIDRSHAAWIIFVAIATLAAVLLFTANFYPHRLPFAFSLPVFLGPSPPLRHTFGGTPLGLIFGALAFLIFVFAAALGVRKKKRTWPIGNVQWWLKAHIWLTILTVPLVLFHCGFHFGGWQTSGLMLLYAVVMVSGFVGLALQHFVPGLMRERLSREVIFEEIPYLRGLLVHAATELRDDLKMEQTALAGKAAAGATTAADPDERSVSVITRFIAQDCIPYLAARRGERHGLGSARSAAAAFYSLKLNVDPRWKPRIEQLQRWCDERRMMDLQTRYQHLLHGWLIIHVPASFALLVFAAWHTLAAVSFLPAPN